MVKQSKVKILCKIVTMFLFSTISCFAKLINFSISGEYNSNDIFKNTNRANIGFEFSILSMEANLTHNLVDKKVFQNKIVNNIKDIKTNTVSLGKIHYYTYDILAKLRLISVFHNNIYFGYKYYDVFKKDNILEISSDNRLYSSHSFFAIYGIEFNIIGIKTYIQYTSIKDNIKNNMSYGTEGYYIPIKNTKISLRYSYLKDLEKNDYDDGITIPYMKKNNKLLYLRHNNRIGNIEKKILMNEFHIVTLDGIFGISNFLKFSTAVQFILDKNKKSSYIFRFGFVF